MRNLNGHDVFMALKVLKKVGVKDELLNLAQWMREGKEESSEKVGAKLIFSVLANAGDEEAEKAFFEFLSGPLEKSAKELADEDLLDLADEVDTFVKSVDKERWKSFFHSLLASLKRT